jgi:hypothetical protein
MDQDNTQWQYKPDGGAPSGGNDSQDEDNSAPAESSHRPKTVTWEAVEYIDHDHGASWYLALIVVIAALAALAYFLAKDILGVFIIVIVGFVVAIMAGQKPKQAQYEVNESGLSVNGKLYPYSSYKSFAVINEGDLSSVNLFPLKRFLPPLSAYFDPKDEKKITNAVGNYLPYEDRKLDSIDRIARRIRL